LRPDVRPARAIARQDPVISTNRGVGINARVKPFHDRFGMIHPGATP
jgi:hypothetical protein